MMSTEKLYEPIAKRAIIATLDALCANTEQEARS